MKYKMLFFIFLFVVKAFALNEGYDFLSITILNNEELLIENSQLIAIARQLIEEEINIDIDNEDIRLIDTNDNSQYLLNKSEGASEIYEKYVTLKRIVDLFYNECDLHWLILPKVCFVTAVFYYNDNRQAIQFLLQEPLEAKEVSIFF